jgi:GH24 family phage-related lysozyme (muramidase)
MDRDLAWKLADLRGQIAKLGSAIRQLRQAGMDSAAAQLLITRKRAELEGLMTRRDDRKADLAG